MTSSDIDPFDGTVAASSRLIAAFRAVETAEGTYALLHDELAYHLAGPSALQEVKEDLKPASNGKRQYQATRFAFRARWFDDHIVHAITSTSSSPDPSSPLPIRQVVLLGAGMDSRAWRLPHLKNTTWFELDRPGVLQAKLSMLQRVGAQGGSVYNEQGLVMEGSDGNAQSWRYPLHCAQWRGVEHDLTAPNAAWLHTLRAAGWDPTHPTVWAAEGLLLYLPQEDADAVLAAVSEHSTAGSWWVVQLLTLDSIAAFQKSTFEDNALVKEFRSGVPRDAGPFFASLPLGGWVVEKELGYVGIAEPYLQTPGMEANLAVASQLDVHESDLDGFFRFFVLKKK